jgi:hypothetical protein
MRFHAILIELCHASLNTGNSSPLWPKFRDYLSEAAIYWTSQPFLREYVGMRPSREARKIGSSRFACGTSA